ncbi:glycosyltransferase [Chryseobacterium fistulae]|uniref:Alpha-D-kanosaminyltransferase n=1 Tax=Chryseobacterium fistulae TaxID=2675058 RepID=A0A6N4XPZ0_9FLAO|nr:glycosyltransferase [Chryseobacterium fistulae]CAA7386206.1 Alpha-D-kanosaminyltransferase [Chryseobacterium fistulae]
MKILQLGKFYPIRGGVEKVMFDLMVHLSGKNIYCDMLCASEDTGNADEAIIINPFSTIYITKTYKEIAKTKISPSIVMKLRGICHKYDIIHIHHPDPMVALALYLSGYKGKVVLHWHSDILAQKKLLKFYEPLQKWIIKRADVIIGTSVNYLKNSQALIPFKNKCLAVPIGIEDIFEKNKNIQIKEAKKYDGKKVIFSLGRLVSYKGFEYLIDSALHLNDDYVILIGGSGPLKNILQKRIQDQGLNNKVKLLGYLSDEDVLQYYSLCDIFCLSSIEKTEAFGIVQIEAMCFSKPVIATKIEGSGVSWVNKDGITGINVEVRNSKQIANAIKKITFDLDYYRKTSLASRNRFVSMFTIERMSESILNIYDDLYD